MDVTTILNVEILSVGMKWPSASGEITLTFEHLADAVAASADVHIRPPRLKLGHSDERFNADRRIDHDPFYTGDAEPAIGSLANLSLVDNDAVLVADYVEVPVWLAQALPTCYPSRSAEGAYVILERNSEPIGSWNVTTPGGKTYSFVLTACALLGTVPPAIADLEDLRRFVVEGRGAVIAGRDPATGGVAASGSIEPVTKVDLEADVDKVIVAFCEEFCIGDRYAWWPRSFRVDPNAIIADDEAGGLWRVTATTDSEQGVTWGEPEQVLQTYVPAPAASAQLASLSASADLEGRVVARFASRAELPEQVREGGVAPSASIPAMDFTKEQRTTLIAKHSLAAEATDEQIMAAVLAAPTEETPPEGDEAAAAAAKAAEDAEAAKAAAAAETPAEGDTTPPAGGAEASGAETMTVSKAAWDESQATLKRLAGADAKGREKTRETELEAHIKRGAITPGVRADWAAKFAADEDTTRKELEAFPDNLIPVDMRGHGGGQVPADAAAGPHAPTHDEMSALFGPAYSGGASA